MNLVRDLLPDPARSDVGAVLVTQRTVGTSQRATAQAVTAEWERTPWPEGLVSLNCYLSTDGESVLTYEQWTGEEALHAFARARRTVGTDAAEPVEYRLYRSGSRDDAPEPGCIVIVSVEFVSPDRQRQERWVDTVFDALAAETEPRPGGISAHFHLSVDGTRVLNYAEWTDEEAHREALENSGQGTVGSAPEWRRVLDFPGVKDSGFKRYRFYRSLARPH